MNTFSYRVLPFPKGALLIRFIRRPETTYGMPALRFAMQSLAEAAGRMWRDRMEDIEIGRTV